jgi:hypothetical protein
MVIGERFAWAHLPKTGGDTTRELFQLFPGLVEQADPGDTNLKHDVFTQRRADIEGKVLAMNFRRLPAWVLSRAQHVTVEGLYPDYVPLPMATSDEMAASDLPNTRLEEFTDYGRLEMGAFLRLEYLRDDFLQFVRSITEVTAEMEQRVYDHPARDVRDYDHKLAQWFSREQLERMYERNPTWAALEQKLYGDLLLDPERTPPVPRAEQ